MKQTNKQTNKRKRRFLQTARPSVKMRGVELKNVALEILGFSSLHGVEPDRSMVRHADEIMCNSFSARLSSEVCWDCPSTPP